MANVLFQMENNTNNTVTVVLVLVVHHVNHLNVIATVTMVNVFSMPVTLQNHVFVMTDTLVHLAILQPHVKLLYAIISKYAS